MTAQQYDKILSDKVNSSPVVIEVGPFSFHGGNTYTSYVVI
jgi:hypothetical protein